MKIQDIKPSRQYGWVFTGPVRMLKGGRGDLPENPLGLANVEQRAIFTGQAATHQMYINAQKRLNPEWKESDRKSQFEQTENPCVVRSLASGEDQVRILNPIKGQVQYTINGRPATEAEIAIIEQYKEKHSRPSNSVKIMFPYVQNLDNVE